jgi:hypothetical protein
VTEWFFRGACARKFEGATVANTDIQEQSDRIDSLATKVDALRRYL